MRALTHTLSEPSHLGKGVQGGEGSLCRENLWAPVISVLGEWGRLHVEVGGKKADTEPPLLLGFVSSL